MSASPAPSTDSQAPSKVQEQITFRFCRECSNMLYPKEDKLTSRLMFACRTCQFSEEAQSSCVFRNNMYNTVGETAGVTQDVGSDPTVCDPDFSMVCCVFCGGEIGDEGDAENVDWREQKRAMSRRGAGEFDLAEMSRIEEDEDEDDDEEKEEEEIDTSAQARHLNNRREHYMLSRVEGVEVTHAQPARVSART